MDGVILGVVSILALGLLFYLSPVVGGFTILIILSRMASELKKMNERR